MLSYLQQGHTIYINEIEQQFVCRPKEMLLAGMVRLGKRSIPVGCRSGGCGVCKVQVQQGEYATGKMSRAHISEQEEQAGYVLACRCEPKSDLVITVIGQMRKATHA